MRSLELRNKLSKLLRMQDLCGWPYCTGTDTTYICIHTVYYSHKISRDAKELPLL